MVFVGWEAVGASVLRVSLAQSDAVLGSRWGWVKPGHRSLRDSGPPPGLRP